MLAQPKPLRGQHVLDREQKRAEYEATLDTAKKAAKKRDGFVCRWPELHKCRGLLEGVHIEDASLGGAPATANIFTCCAWYHRRGPISIHGKTAKVEPEDETLGADGNLAFYTRPSIMDEWTCVGVESAIGVLRKN